MIKRMFGIWMMAVAWAGVSAAGPSTAATAATAAASESVRDIEITVTDGYSPSEIVIEEGERVRLVFVRKSWSGCTREVVIPHLDLRRVLAPNQRTTVDLPELPPGDYAFHCGMKMIHGNIRVLPR